MKTQAFLFLLWRNLMSARKRAFLATLGVGAAGVVWMIIFFALWMAHFEIAPQVEAMFPANRMVVRPKPVNLSIIQLGATRISDEATSRITALNGVQSVYRQSAITFPLRATLSILGESVDTDAIVNGVDPALVADDMGTTSAFVYYDDPSADVPVMASRYFLDMYNMGYAESQGLPRVNQSAVIGRTFNLILGESIASGPRERTRTIRCRIVGLTTDVSLIGLVVPLEYASKWNEWHSGKKGTGYTALHVAADGSKEFSAVEKGISEMGYTVESRREALDRARLMLWIMSTGTLALGGLVIFLAGLNLWNTFTLILMQQRKQIGTLRAIGATPGLIFRLYGGEAMVLALTGCLLALVVGWISAALVLSPLEIYLKDFPFLDDVSLTHPAVAAGISLFLVFLAVSLFALPQIARLSRRAIIDLI